jgi:hypothetical protein
MPSQILISIYCHHKKSEYFLNVFLEFQKYPYPSVPSVRPYPCYLIPLVKIVFHRLTKSPPLLFSLSPLSPLIEIAFFSSLQIHRSRFSPSACATEKHISKYLNKKSKYLDIILKYSKHISKYAE